MIDQIESFIMSSNEFGDFLRVLTYWSDMNTDLHIVNRKILQRVNSNLAIIRCDLLNLLKLDGEVILYNIPMLVKNLKGLAKNCPIRFRRLGNSLIIKDATTSISIALGEEKNCENKIIPEVEFNEIYKLGSMFFECDIDKGLCNSLNSFSRVNNQRAVMLRIRSGNGVFGYEIGSRIVRSEFKVKHKLKEDMFDCDINLPAMIFNTKFAFTLRVYFNETNCPDNSIAVCIFNFFINEKMTFEIYSRSNILKGQDEE
jgi:hypothetical protein